MKMSKNILYEILMGFFVMTLNGCHCSDCPNRLQDKLSALPYKDHAIVQFQKENSNIENSDTVHIAYSDPSGAYNCAGEKEGTTVCHGSLTMDIGDYGVSMRQGFVDDTPSTKVNDGFGISYHLKEGVFKIKETINIQYRGSIISVQHFQIDTESSYARDHYNKLDYCSDFYITSDYKLIQYILMKNNEPERWILKE